ncbi:DNA-binding transcriptional MerR regulator [Hamadaea flava]|uniref:Helix-turn-helix domain-containing protein n=1 Tax=Hamadaea flava TaxID=1742688 RepID=A0ABV8LQQ7_9ACTN|nr:helix-turn-helix domain-containing protein [Hamadaea flava]MCP2322283.1 DNA-binding transcriptional MerR regulator [Hamadaea flava]
MRLLTIGQAARLAGVTAMALRHYDAIGLLRPAVVDPATGYRRYEQDQVDQARRIRQLRALDLPLDVVRRLLESDLDTVREALRQHRTRVDARITRLRGVLHAIDHALTDDGEPTMTTPEYADEADQHRHFAKTLFNEVWRLMEKEDRSPADDAWMIHMAHASAYHWLEVGTPENVARSHWQCSRVYTVVGRAEPALYHAHLVLETCRANGIGDWDLAFAYEALSRAYTLAGEKEQARSWLERARLAADEIAADDDRELLLADLATILV